MRYLVVVALCVALSAISGSSRAADKKEEVKAMPAPIVFFDIAGPDAAKLKSFYGSVFAWDIDASNGIKTGGLDGTLRQDPTEKIIYVGVPDINAALDQIKAAGGSVDTPRIVVPNVVIFALFKDPAGNRMGLVEMPKK